MNVNRLFLNSSSVYDENQKEQFRRDLEGLKERKEGSFLRMTPEGRVVQSRNVFHWLYSKYQGLKGNFDGTSKEVIQYQTIKILAEGAERGWIASEDRKFVEEVINSVKSQQAGHDVDAFSEMFPTQDTDNLAKFIYKYFRTHRAELVPKKWSTEPEPAFLRSLKDHPLYSKNPSEVDERIQEPIALLQRTMHDFEKVMQPPLNEEKQRELLALEKTLEEVQNSLINLSEIVKELPTNAPLRKEWGDLFILSTALASWKMYYSEACFYGEILKLLAEKGASSHLPSLEALHSFVSLCLDQLFLLSRYISQPSDFYTKGILVPVLTRNEEDQPHFTFINEAPHFSKKSFVDEMREEVPKDFSAPHQKIFSGIEPIKQVGVILRHLGYSKTLVDGLIEQINSQLSEGKQEEVLEIIRKALQREDKFLTEKECKEIFMKKLEIAYDQKLQELERRGEKLHLLPFAEIMQGFMEVEGLTSEEWEKLTEFKLTPHLELILCRNEKQPWHSILKARISP